MGYGRRQPAREWLLFLFNYSGFDYYPFDGGGILVCAPRIEVMEQAIATLVPNA